MKLKLVAWILQPDPVKNGRNTQQLRKVENMKYKLPRPTPYLEIDDETNSIFIKIPRTGGGSICRSLYSGALVGHRTALSLAKGDPDRFRDYFKFAIMRDPLERFVSAFDFLIDGGVNWNDTHWSHKYLYGLTDISEFIQLLNFKVYKDIIFGYTHFRPQYDYVFDKDGDLIVDYIGTVENLFDDYANLRNIIGIGDQDLVSVNSSKNSRLTSKALEDISIFVGREYAIDNELWKNKSYACTNATSADKVELEIDAYENRDPRLLFAVGEFYKKNGNIEKSLYCFTKITGIFPDYHAAYHQLSTILLSCGQLDDAIDSLETAMKISHNNPVYMYFHGKLMLETDQLTRAEEDLKSAIILRPKHRGVIEGHSRDKYYPAAVYELASVYIKKKQFPAAISLLSETLKNIPHSNKLRMQYVNVLIYSGFKKQAVLELREALKRRPVNIAGYRTLEKLLDDINEQDSALEVAKQATSHCAFDRRSWANLGNRYLKRNDFILAEITFNSGLKHLPNNPTLLVGLGKALLGMDRLTECKLIAKIVEQLDPNNKSILEFLKTVNI